MARVCRPAGRPEGGTPEGGTLEAVAAIHDEVAEHYAAAVGPKHEAVKENRTLTSLSVAGKCACGAGHLGGGGAP